MSKFEQVADRAQPLEASFEHVMSALRAPEEHGLSVGQLQTLFAEIVRNFAELREFEKDLSPFPENCDVSATEVAIAATGILEAADMAVFELGMWQTLKQ